MSDIILRRKFLKAADDFARRGDITTAPVVAEAFLNLLAHTFGEHCTLSIGDDMTIRVEPITDK